MKLLLTVTVLTASVMNALAQSCCCIGAGANYTILPNLDKHVLGVRYEYAAYNTVTSTTTHMKHGNHDMVVTGPDKRGTAALNTVDIFGRFNLYKGLQLAVFMPVHVLSEKTDGTIHRTSGLGDMSFLLQYGVLNPAKCNGKISKQQLRFGAGLKLPSGQFSMNTDGLSPSYLQLGTGSVDFLFNAIYTYRYKKFGFNFGSAYKLNTTNPKGYRFADKIQENINLFYLFDVSNIQLMPSVGFSYEHQSDNRFNKEAVDGTGGDLLRASVGFDIYYKQFAFSSSISPALMNSPDRQGKNKLNFEAGVFYNFSINQ